MINFAFFKSQLKNITWITLGISLIFAIITVYLFQGVGIIQYALGIMLIVPLVTKLFIIENNRGYLSSLLSLPMSRTSIFLTKFLVIFIAIFSVSFINLIDAIIMTFISFDLTITWLQVWALIKINLGLLLTFLLIMTIAIACSLAFDKSSIAITLSILIPAFFTITFWLSESSDRFDIKWWKYFKYVTIFTLFDNNKLFIVENLEYIWKYAIAIIISGAISIGTLYYFNKKNLYS